MQVMDVLIKKEVELLENCSDKYSKMLRRIVSKFTNNKDIIDKYSNIIEGITWGVVFIFILTLIIRAF